MKRTRIRPRRKEKRDRPEPDLVAIVLPLGKPRRIKDPVAVNAARLAWCEVCLRRDRPTHSCHWRSRGARGDDVRENLYSGCFICHDREHTKGAITSGINAFMEARNRLANRVGPGVVACKCCGRDTRPRWGGEAFSCEHCGELLPLLPPVPV